MATNGLHKSLEFTSNLLANRQWHFRQANHGRYSNPGSQVGAQNKDIGGFLKTDLTRT